jgi:3-oxoacyl-[acyl-carrier-protein] synthase-3
MDIVWPIVIRGTGANVPERVVTNQYFEERLDTSDEWIRTRTGIERRHWAAPDKATSDHAAAACRLALDNAGMTIDDIDAIICTTATGDHMFPATACLVQHKLGAKDIPAFDIGAACAGFMYGCAVAAGLISAGGNKNILVVGAETLSRFADPEDRATSILFGDGAGAAVWSRSPDPERGVVYHEWGVDGSKSGLIWAPAGGSRYPTSETTIAERLQFLHMRGREVFKFAVIKMQELIDRALERLNLSPDDLKMMIPHQSNMRIIQAMRERMGLPKEKVVLNIDEYGNTSAASIPLALDAARRSGQLEEGDLVLLIGIGAGMTWSIIVLRL